MYIVRPTIYCIFFYLNYTTEKLTVNNIVEIYILAHIFFFQSLTTLILSDPLISSSVTILTPFYSYFMTKKRFPKIQFSRQIINYVCIFHIRYVPTQICMLEQTYTIFFFFFIFIIIQGSFY